MNDTPDNQLVARTLYGDEKAFEVIVRRYQKIVYNVLLNMLRDHERTADAMQETFLKLYRALPTYRTEHALKPWLLRIATNTALNMIRDMKQVESLDEILEESPFLEPAESRTPELEVERKLTLTAVGDALAKLPARQRNIFVLRYQHDSSYAEIATITGETEGAVKMQLFRAREKLRASLYDKAGVEGGL
jgi:RNA polymerase sigma-70 factor (ECF subfamily)